MLRNKAVVQTDILIGFYLRSRRREDSGRRCTRAIVLSKQSASNAKSHVRRRGFNCVGGKYGARTRDLRRDRPALFTYEGLKFAVAHYREDLPVGSVDVAINGHTHVTKEAQVGRCLVLNPGSASYPRGTRGPTMARMLVKDGKIISTKFIDLD